MLEESVVSNFLSKLAGDFYLRESRCERALPKMFVVDSSQLNHLARFSYCSTALMEERKRGHRDRETYTHTHTHTHTNTNTHTHTHTHTPHTQTNTHTPVDGFRFVCQ